MVLFHMSLKRHFIIEGFLALLTLNLILAVPFLVCIECVLPQESGTTDPTIELLLGFMLFLVVGQVALGREGTTTALELTAEGLFACVDAHVGLQVSILGEGLLAHLAFERLFACVGSLMDF